MIKFILKHFVKNYEDVKNPKVREGYGRVASLISIFCNIFLCVIKYIVGIISKSVAIQADAFNNLSDAGSNIATLLGFRLAEKKPDQDHPYGHGRYEYIMGLVIAFLIFLVAFSSLKESFLKIIKPEQIQFRWITVFILIISIIIKLGMAYINKDFSKRIDAPSLKAASQDSLNDCVTTAATLISVIFAYFSHIPIDGWISLLVSLFVLRAGFDVFFDTVHPLLGKAPDPQLIKAIEDYVLSHSRILGIHDLIVHDYGPSRLFVTLHVEVRADEDILEAHDLIDSIEREISARFSCLATIHMDPIDVSDEKTNALKNQVIHIIQSIDPEYTIHDFRIVSGPTHTNLIFDVVLPADDYSDERLLKAYISDKIKELDSSYFTVLNIDHRYL